MAFYCQLDAAYYIHPYLPLRSMWGRSYKFVWSCFQKFR